jgi:phenylacetate-CoA ligase
MTDFNSEYLKKTTKLNSAARKKALKTFHLAAENVPAYRDFLNEHKISHKKIRTFEDFQSVPPVNKDNYLRKYPMNELMWAGNKFAGDMISVSSGSSGEPYFWLRDQAQHDEAADIYYDIYKNIFNADKIPTLLVVCFSMGIWIAGSYTTLGAMAAKRKGLKINLITPALDIFDSIAVIEKLKKDYKQIILAGYPPFLKDLVDRGAESGINWLDLNVGFTAAGEAIGEELRDYFIKKGTKYNDPTKAISIYGTVDAGILAHETPLSIILRRQIYQNNLQESYFGKQVLPTLAQYDPLKKYIEIVDGRIVFTSATAMPLIRYDIKDLGGSYDNLTDLIVDGKEFDQSISKNGIDIGKYHLPFVYVHGRADFTASLYAVLIYPENIKKALLSEQLVKFTSGRFVMSIKHKKNLDQYLEIVVELRNGTTSSKKLLSAVEKGIMDVLSSDNFEYRKLLNSIGSRAHPIVILKNADDMEYFSRTSNKQQWTTEAIKNR